MTISVRKSLKEHYVISFILAIAAGLYLYQIGSNSLWLDEFNSIADAQRFPEEVSLLRPVYFVLLHVWMLFGDSVEWLRGLSVVFGLGAVYLLYELGARLADRRSGYIAALLLACSPLFINHVQEVRMYSLGSFLSLLSSLFLLDAIQQPTNFNIGKWSIGRVITVLTIPLSILMLVPDTLIIGWRFRHRVRLLGKFAAALLFAGILLLPATISMVTSAGPSFVSDWTAELPKPGLVSVVSKLASFTVFWPLAELPKSLPIKALYYLYTMAAAVVVAIALLNTKRRAHSNALLLAVWLLIPAAIMLLFSYILSPIWNSRYLLFLSPYLFVLVAIGFTKVQQQSRSLSSAIALLYVLTLIGGLNHYYVQRDRDDWRSAFDMVMQAEQTGDALTIYAPMTTPELAADYYYEGPAPISAMASLGNELAPDAVGEMLGAMPAGSDRLWFVLRGFNGNPEANQVIEQAISEKFDVQSYQRFAGPVDVFLVTERRDIKQATTSSRN